MGYFVTHPSSIGRYNILRSNWVISWTTGEPSRIPTSRTSIPDIRRRIRSDPSLSVRISHKSRSKSDRRYRMGDVAPVLGAVASIVAAVGVLIIAVGVYRLTLQIGESVSRKDDS